MKYKALPWAGLLAFLSSPTPSLGYMIASFGLREVGKKWRRRRRGQAISAPFPLFLYSKEALQFHKNAAKAVSHPILKEVTPLLSPLFLSPYVFLPKIVRTMRKRRIGLSAECINGAMDSLQRGSPMWFGKGKRGDRMAFHWGSGDHSTKRGRRKTTRT